MATNCQRAETEQFMLWCQDAGREGAMKALARNCDRKRGSCVFPKPFLASEPGETMRLFVCGGFGSADGGVGDEMKTAKIWSLLGETWVFRLSSNLPGFNQNKNNCGHKLPGISGADLADWPFYLSR